MGGRSERTFFHDTSHRGVVAEAKVPQPHSSGGAMTGKGFPHPICFVPAEALLCSGGFGQSLLPALPPVHP